MDKKAYEKSFTAKQLADIAKYRMEMKGATREEAIKFVEKLCNMNKITETDEPDQRNYDHAS